MPEKEHLTMIQAIVTRLAGNSFLIKGWAVTLVAGLTALAKADTQRDIAWIALGVVVVFAFLDAYYLAHERSFRKLYAEAARDVKKAWALKPDSVGLGDVLTALVSFSVWPLYTAAAVGAALVATSL